MREPQTSTAKEPSMWEFGRMPKYLWHLQRTRVWMFHLCSGYPSLLWTFPITPCICAWGAFARIEDWRELVCAEESSPSSHRASSSRSYWCGQRPRLELCISKRGYSVNRDYSKSNIFGVMVHDPRAKCGMTFIEGSVLFWLGVFLLVAMGARAEGGVLERPRQRKETGTCKDAGRGLPWHWLPN